MRSLRNVKELLCAVAAVAFLVLSVFLPLAQSAGKAAETTSTSKGIPRMIDLGRNQCLPCKMMAPVLEELKREYAGIIDIEYVNVAENRNIMKELGINVRAIPFQIFYDASGKDVKRHYGYLSKEEILREFRDLGFDPKLKKSGK